MEVPPIAQAVNEVLQFYQQTIDQELKNVLPRLGEPSRLREACEYALTCGGKRFRPVIVLMIAKALKQQIDVTEAALAIEFFHTASLIADDLPCMDDDDERREHPSLHKVYGEAIALLASYALIAGGYELLQKNAEAIRVLEPELKVSSDRICLLAVEIVSRSSGLSGACGGQLLDVYPPDLSLDTIREVIQKKTVSLFEGSFAVGWLYGGGDPKKLEQVKRLADHFGMAFQVADDLGDMSQDCENERQVNIATLLGKEEATRIFYEEIALYQSMLSQLEVETDELRGLALLLCQYVEEVETVKSETV